MSETAIVEYEGEKRSVPTIIDLGNNNTVDLSILPEEERNQIYKNYIQGQLDISSRGQKMGQDINALKANLSTMTAATKESVDSGVSSTITHTQDSEIGRTEIIMGNTEQAQTGKLSRSQTKEKNWTPFYVILVIVAALAMGAILKGV